MTPVAPFNEITKDMMKNARATIPSDSRHVRPKKVRTSSKGVVRTRLLTNCNDTTRELPCRRAVERLDYFDTLHSQIHT